MSSPTRLAVVTSHPIQYQGPWFRLMAEHPRLDPHVFFCCDHGQKPTLDREFGTNFSWDRDITAGFSHEYLKSLHPNPGPYGFWPLTNPELVSKLSASRFDSLLLVGWGFASCWIAAAAAKAAGLSVLMRGESGHGAYEARPAWKELAREAVLGQLFRGIDAFLAISSDNADLYRSHGIREERIFDSPYAVDNDYFAALAAEVAPRRAELRERLGVTDERPIMVASGKLIARKAPMDLLRAFERARVNVSGKLVFLGDGPLRGELERAVETSTVKDDVVITGFLQQRELADVYGAADLFVLPSHFESWGLVLNEAMLFGMPTICTDRASAHRDLIDPGVTGDVYPCGDVGALAALLEKRLADPQALREMGKKARVRVQDWSLEATVESVVRALDFTQSRGSPAHSSGSTKAPAPDVATTSSR